MANPQESGLAVLVNEWNKLRAATKERQREMSLMPPSDFKEQYAKAFVQRDVTVGKEMSDAIAGMVLSARERFGSVMVTPRRSLPSHSELTEALAKANAEIAALQQLLARREEEIANLCRDLDEADLLLDARDIEIAKLKKGSTPPAPRPEFPLGACRAPSAAPWRWPS